MLESYSSVLSQALKRIVDGDTSAAHRLLDNFYYRRRKWTAKDYTELLQYTLSHRAFIKADDETKNELAGILFYFRSPHNKSTAAYYVSHRRVIRNGEAKDEFRIEAGGSAPAH
ncbi:MAG TPA: hypothetical protein VN081_03550 [Dongiaceae bacterium]|nr:hypothetical protein [Dongiaceae bacterium]